MKRTKPYRYAIYFAGEPQGELWTLGSQWLGRCAMNLHTLSNLEINNLNPGLRLRMTQQPRRYGWHATLKAPFRLKDSLSVEFLIAELKNLALELSVFDLPIMEVKHLRNFLALAPVVSQDGVHTIGVAAQKCVEYLHELSEPLTESEISFRNQLNLSSREETLMKQWGYPYTKELYQFHFTLSDGFEVFNNFEINEITQAAKKWFNFYQPLQFDRISLFVEEAKGQDFKFLSDFLIPK